MSRHCYRKKYNIIFDKNLYKFTCDCKDFLFRSNSKNIICKHISFLVCKVLNILDHDYLKTKIMKIDIKEQLKNNTIWTNNDFSIKFLNNKFKNSDKEFDKNDKCPICYDSFKETPVLNCPSCKNYIHTECVNILLTFTNKCCYCRSTVWEKYKDPKINIKVSQYLR